MQCYMVFLCALMHDVVMQDAQALYTLWRDRVPPDSPLYPLLMQMEGDEQAVSECFYQSLSFGTAGLRGLLGAGTNRMNVYTVKQATQGLADYLNAAFAQSAVAIAYDSRINSQLFAREAAGVLAANGITVHIFSHLAPTPMLSFAVRELQCQSGIVITASHNPAQYNGYKCYDPQGYQMTEEAAQRTQDCIQKVSVFEDVKYIPFAQGIEQGSIRPVTPDLQEAFYEAVLSCSICPYPQTARESGLTVVYSPLNGAGNVPVCTVLKRAGFDGVTVVSAQEQPDGNFPTCPYPNPETRQSFDAAIRLARQQITPPDLLLATDPDCDRVGIAVLDGGDYRLCSGNEVAVLLTHYILSMRKQLGTLPECPLIAKSLVTTPWVDVIAADYGCEVKTLLTGFKYIGECISLLAAGGQENRFVLGMEESYGYLAGTHVRDKDAVCASLLICEMAAHYKQQGKTLLQVLRELTQKYGVFHSTLANLTFDGAAGMKKMDAMMRHLRDIPPEKLGGLAVLRRADYFTRESLDCQSGLKEASHLPVSDVLSYTLSGNCSVIVRPSGTEPKMKIYCFACAGEQDEAVLLAQLLEADTKKQMIEDLG